MKCKILNPSLINSKVDCLRYAYVKNGDVVAQYERILMAGDSKITSGPDAFIFDFMQSIANCPIHLISKGSRNAEFQHKHTTAKVYAYQLNWISRIYARPLAGFKVFLSLLSFKPQRILCGTTGSFLWACFLISKIYSLPLVHSRHNRVSTASDSWYRRIGSIIDNWCIRRTKAVICHGPYLKQELLGIGVPPGKLFEFDVSFTDMQLAIQNNSNKLIRLFENDKLILYFGRIESSKGIFDLLDACNKRLLADSDLRLVYVGSGSDEIKLNNKIAEQDLKHKVLLLGRVEHHDLSALIAKSKVVVTPTRLGFPEGRCMAAMEGLVMGVPVIAPDFGPFPFLITHGINGLLFKPNCRYDLEDKVISVLDDDILYKRLKAGARESGDKLLCAPLSFAQAVEYAFSSTKSH